MGIWACIFFPPPVLGIPGNSFQPNPKRAFLGFRTMTGTTQGRGPGHAPEGNGILRPQFRPQLPSRPTGLLPFGTRALVHSPLPHPSSEPLPTHLCPSPHRAQSPPTFTLPGPSPHPVRSPTSSLRVWRTERHRGLAGVNSASPATHRPRARAHPAAAFSNLSASVSSMMRLFTSSRIMAAAAPGRGRRNKGG